MRTYALPPDDRAVVREAYTRGDATQVELARRFGVCRQTIAKAIQMIEIHLTPDEIDEAITVGEAREALRVARGWGPGGAVWLERNKTGAIAEYAIAKRLGVLSDWRQAKAFTEGDPREIPCDVGRAVHVRATHNPRARYLLVHEAPGERRPGNRAARPTDPESAPFVFAYVHSQVVHVYGWALSSDVRARGEWMDYGPFARRPCYVLDRDELLPLSTLPQEYV